VSNVLAGRRLAMRDRELALTILGSDQPRRLHSGHRESPQSAPGRGACCAPQLRRSDHGASRRLISVDSANAETIASPINPMFWIDISTKPT
jgi:hypothetical protein